MNQRNNINSLEKQIKGILIPLTIAEGVDYSICQKGCNFYDEDEHIGYMNITKGSPIRSKIIQIEVVSKYYQIFKKIIESYKTYSPTQMIELSDGNQGMVL